uniref:Uncharacterized protein n=1 Tax=Nelumbo nucifera TaxID=4432 RepID=A0A822ZN21_NELNU|nr:TPA_asm: hypothetical protein HUJ06_004403 [Nelumbo nucifera]
MKNLHLVLTNVQICEASSISTSEKDLEQKDPPLPPTLKAKGESGHEEVIIRCKPQDGKDSRDLSIHQTSNGAGDKDAVESDDKENDLSSDNNRFSRCNKLWWLWPSGTENRGKWERKRKRERGRGRREIGGEREM